jgi:6-phosphofructokinase 1
MGRNSGYIALHSGIAGGAGSIIIPEEETTFEQLYEKLMAGEESSKKSNLVVVAEGSKIGGVAELAKQVAERTSYFDIKVTILGHLQRGGAPSYFDRVLASKMGVAAVEGLMEGKNDAMVGILNNKIVYNPFDMIMTQHHAIDAEALRIAKILTI